MKTRREAVDWARDHLKKRDFIILDFETTGLPPDKKNPKRPKPEPVSVAVINAYGTPILQTYLKPVRTAIDPEAEAVHHVSDAMVADAPSFKVLYDTLARWGRGRTVIAYNDWFEKLILDYAYQHNNLPLLDLEFSCAMKAYAAYREEVGKFGYAKNFKLTDAIQHELPDIDLSNAHDALADVQLTLMLIKAMGGWGLHNRIFIDSVDPFTLAQGEVIKKAVQRAVSLNAEILIDDKPTECNDFTQNECGRYKVPCQTWGYEGGKMADYWNGLPRLRGGKDYDHFACLANHVAIPERSRERFILGTLLEGASIVLCFDAKSPFYTLAVQMGLKPILYGQDGKLIKTVVDYVFNVNLDDPDVVYIGRAQKNPNHPKLANSKWGNPFSKSDPAVGTKDKAIALYQEWIVQQPNLIADLEELRGKRLVCWCKKKGDERCHGDVLLELLEGKN